MEYDLELLKKKSQKYRKAIIELIYRAKAGHPGGSLSCIDILNYLYTYKIDFNNENRSRLVLSKGHVTPAIYAVFMDLGFINDDEIDTFRRVNSRPFISIAFHPKASILSFIGSKFIVLFTSFLDDNLL